MFPAELFAFIFCELGEHFSPDPHVMPVDKGVHIQEIRIAPHIHEDRAQLVIIVGKCFRQILFIVRALHDRIADNRRLVEPDPGYRIRILLQQCVKINTEPFSIPISCNGKIFDLIIFFPSGIVGNEHHDKLIQ